MTRFHLKRKTKMKIVDLIRAIFLPLLEPPVFLMMVLFWIVVCIGTSGSPMGIFVLILCLAPLFRYQSIVVEATAKGESPGAFDAEFFGWAGSMWTMFPLLLAAALALLGYTVEQVAGQAGVLGVLLFAALFLPASMAVLAITHSPLQSVNPVAIGRLLGATLKTYWIAPVYLMIAGWGATQALQFSVVASNFVFLFVFFSAAAVIGTVIEPYGLVDDVDIPEPQEQSAEEVSNKMTQQRDAVLAHAYGFASRGNRDGGFDHILESIRTDADEVGAWAWYFDRMTRWEEPQHALFFAQLYIHDLLNHGDEVPALKLILRCRLIDERFKPRAEDLPAAIAAAERNGNFELAAVLQRS